MTKLLVLNPENVQEIITIGPGGGYYDPARVIWDERKDGAFPADRIPSVGGLVRIGNDLQIDAAMLTAHQAKKAAEAANAETKRQKKEQADTDLKALDLTKNWNANEVQAALKALIVKVMA